MKIPFNEIIFKKKLLEAPQDVKDLALYMENEKVIKEITEEFQLDILSAGDLVHDIILIIFGFSSYDQFLEDITTDLNFDSKTALDIYNRINLSIFAPFEGYIKAQQAILKQVGTNQKKTSHEDSLSHHDILGEIENPTPSIIPSFNSQFHSSAPTRSTSTSSTVSISNTRDNEGAGAPIEDSNLGANVNTGGTPSPTPTLQEAIGNIPALGGFKPAGEMPHPAQPIADKLQQKFSAPSNGAPKEIYQIKKIDPYHEPLE